MTNPRCSRSGLPAFALLLLVTLLPGCHHGKNRSGSASRLGPVPSSDELARRHAFEKQVLGILKPIALKTHTQLNPPVWLYRAGTKSRSAVALISGPDGSLMGWLGAWVKQRWVAQVEFTEGDSSNPMADLVLSPNMTAKNALLMRLTNAAARIRKLSTNLRHGKREFTDRSAA